MQQRMKQGNIHDLMGTENLEKENTKAVVIHGYPLLEGIKT